MDKEYRQKILNPLRISQFFENSATSWSSYSADCNSRKSFEAFRARAPPDLSQRKNKKSGGKRGRKRRRYTARKRREAKKEYIEKRKRYFHDVQKMRRKFLLGRLSGVSIFFVARLFRVSIGTISFKRGSGVSFVRSLARSSSPLAGLKIARAPGKCFNAFLFLRDRARLAASSSFAVRD